MAQAMMGADMAATPSPQMLPLLGTPVLDLLDDKLPVSQAVRSSVLHLIRLLIAGLRDGCTPAEGVRAPLTQATEHVLRSLALLCDLSEGRLPC